MNINQPTNNETKAQYNSVSNEWNDMVGKDPVKALVQYHTVITLLGDVSGKAILDIGSGNGAFSRLLAEKGAEVIGYDASSELVKGAQSKEQKGVSFVPADQFEFSTEKRFDDAVAINVLNYAKDRAELSGFFASAYKHLKNGGRFVAMVFNPDFDSYGTVVLNRRIEKPKEGENEMTVVFINPETKKEMRASFYYFSKADFEESAKDAGFSDIKWTEAQTHPSLAEVNNGALLEEFKKHNLYSVIVVEK